MKTKQDLLIDVDEVIIFSGFLEAINEFLGTNYVIDDFTDYYIDEVAIPKERMDEFNKFISDKNLYDKASILPGAVETIKELSEKYNIYLLSSCVNPFDIENSGINYLNKYNMLRKALPFIKPENFIFTSAKHLFKAYAKIDDRLSNFSDKDDIELKILFPSYHNKNVTDEELDSKGVVRAGYEWRDGWSNVKQILDRLCEKDMSSEKIK